MMPTTTGPQMMSGMEMSMLLWIIPAILLSLLVIGACVWLILRSMKKQGISPKQSGDQPQDAYPIYEQGYQAEQPPAEKPSQEAGQLYSFTEPTSQYEEPQVQYPQIVSSEH